MNMALAAAVVAAFVSCKGGNSSGAEAQSQDTTYVCAYVWPSCHDDSLAQIPRALSVSAASVGLRDG